MTPPHRESMVKMEEVRNQAEVTISIAIGSRVPKLKFAHLALQHFG